MGERFSWDKLLRRGKQDEDNTINITPNEEPMAPVASLKSTNPVAQSVPLAKASPDTMAPPPLAQEPSAPKAPLVIEWNQYQQIADTAQPTIEASAPSAPPTASAMAPIAAPAPSAPSMPPAANSEVSEAANAFWNKMGSETTDALHSAPATAPPTSPAGVNLGWDDVELTPAERAAGKTGELPPAAQVPEFTPPAPTSSAGAEVPPFAQSVPPSTPEPEMPAGIVEAEIFQPIQVELLGAVAPEWTPAAPVEPTMSSPAPVTPAPVAPEPITATAPISFSAPEPVVESAPSPEALKPIEVGEPLRSSPFGSNGEEKPRLMGFGEGTKVLSSTSEPISLQPAPAQEPTSMADPTPPVAATPPNPWASLTEPVEAPVETPTPTPVEAPAPSAWNLPPVTPSSPAEEVAAASTEGPAWNLPPVTTPAAEESTPAPAEAPVEEAPVFVSLEIEVPVLEQPVTEAPAWNLPPVAAQIDAPAVEASVEATTELPPMTLPAEETTSNWGQIDTTPAPEPAKTEAPFSWSQISEAAPVMPTPITAEEPLVAELPPIAAPSAPAWGAPEAVVPAPVSEAAVTPEAPAAPTMPPIFETPSAPAPALEVPAVESTATEAPAAEIPSIFTMPPAATATPDATQESEATSDFTTPPAAATPAPDPMADFVQAPYGNAVPAAYVKRPADDLSVQKARDNRLGDLLVGNKLITQKQLDRALERQKETNERLGQILIAMQTMSEKRLLQVLSAQKGVSPWHLETDTPMQDAVALVPEEMCRIFQVIPVAIRGDLLLLAMRDTEDIEAIESIRNYTKRRIEPVLADEARLAYTIDKSFGIAETRRLAAMDGLVGEAMDGVDHSRPLGTQERAILSEEDTRPVVGLINQIIEDGIRMRASDIHIEPGYEKIEIRYRLDGRLTTVRDLPAELLPMLVARIKILSELDIVEYRMPQDGRITAQFGPHVVDLRVSVLPNYHGPRVVLRILDKSVGLKRLTDLGFENRNLTLFKDLVAKPYGLFLVTGPTGSGKTTTLYSALNELRDTATNIMTCEDPVEYDLAGINQSQVNEKVGLTFAHQLRAILRQDPDVVLVGEIRDKETAETAIRAAMTGHMVLSTLHCNDAPGAIPRLLDMGVDPYLLSTALVGTMSQRLVRVLCQHCKTEDDATPEETETMAKLFGVPDVKKIWRATGCDECYNTGYKGRMAVHEIMPVAEEIAHLIAERAPMETLRAKASYYGYLPMQQDAAARVLRGETTLEEAKRLISFDTFEKLETPRSLEWKSAS